MTPYARFRSWLRASLRRSGMEREMDNELRFHIERYTEDLVREGVSLEEARRRANAARRSGSASLTTCVAMFDMPFGP